MCIADLWLLLGVHNLNAQSPLRNKLCKNNTFYYSISMHDRPFLVVPKNILDWGIMDMILNFYLHFSCSFFLEKNSVKFQGKGNKKLSRKDVNPNQILKIQN